MKKKNVYFIFTIEEDGKLYSIEIESINIQELSNTTLHQEISLSTNKNTFFVFLKKITFKCNNLEDSTLKLKLIFDGKTFFSQESNPKQKQFKIYIYFFF